MAEGTIAQTHAAVADSTSKGSASERLVSLDAFRGAVIALMVLVNDPGDGQHVYGPLRHAEWHGWTITDVVFPSFLWIAGVALTLSFARRLAQGVPRRRLVLQVFRRAAILYALGLILYGFPKYDLSTLRLLGVLQRIAICYCIASAIYLMAGIRGQLIWIVSLLGAYWLTMTLIPAPGFGRGRLDVEGNLAHYVDRVVLGTHNYAHTKTWDPEGIVSTLPAIATTLLGMMAGHILRLRRALAERTTWLFVLGNILIGLGLICDIWLPINKKLWTSSFSIFMAGLDFVLLAIFIWWIDGVGHKRVVKPLVILGMNAIAIYMVSELLAEVLDLTRWHGWIYRHVFLSVASPVNASLFFAAAYTVAMYFVAYALYRRGWFLRV